MSFMEQLLLIYRTIATIPVWLLFYEGIGMGSLLTSLMRGEALLWWSFWHPCYLREPLSCLCWSTCPELACRSQPSCSEQPPEVIASRMYAGLYLWFKGRNLYLEILASYAFAKALVRREFVYGQVVSPADPQLMEGGSTCPICQVRCKELSLQTKWQSSGKIRILICLPLSISTQCHRLAVIC